MTTQRPGKRKRLSSNSGAGATLMRGPSVSQQRSAAHPCLRESFEIILVGSGNNELVPAFYSQSYSPVERGRISSTNEALTSTER